MLSIGLPAGKPNRIPSNRHRPDAPFVGKTSRCDRRCQDVRDSDAAPDISIFPSALDATTGGRQLEEIAVEVLDTERMSHATEKVAKRLARGVRRLFAIPVASRTVYEWDHAHGDWTELDSDAVITDRCFRVPIPARALVDRVLADDTVARALLASGNRVISAALDERREAGLEEGVRASLLRVLSRRGLALSDATRSANGCRRAVTSRCSTRGSIAQWTQRPRTTCSTADRPSRGRAMARPVAWSVDLRGRRDALRPALGAMGGVGLRLRNISAMFGAMSPRMKSRGLGRAVRAAVAVAWAMGSAGCWELRSGPLVAADAADRETIMSADVGTTSDVDVVDVVDVAGPDSGNAADVTLIDAPMVDVTLMDVSSLDATSGDVTVVDTAAVEDSAMDVPGVDTAIADAAPALDATTVDTGSVSDSGVADTGTPLACDSGTHLCGSTCVSDTSVTSCGSSCSPCGAPVDGTATCVGGACGASCPSGATVCGGACVFFASDASNCGACDRVCPSGQSCSAGVCGTVCLPGTSLCGSSCVALGGTCMSSGSGGCAQSGILACSAGSAVCSVSARTSGACSSPFSGVCNAMGNCVCGSGTHLCESRCVSDTSVTLCGSSCTACAVPTGGSATCSGGVCGQSCPSGTSLCGSACIALTTTAHCGACGRACTVGQSCSGGTCVSSGDAGTGSCPTGMVYIPAGSFLMGDADTAIPNAQPPHMVTLSAYCMDLTEVTVAAYRGCTSCTPPTAGTTANSGNWGVTGRDNHPVNLVDWNQARAYCQSRVGDLPTEAQWEYAARGSDVANHIYPWGNAAPASQLCWSGVTARSTTCPVQSYPGGNSPFGLFDMAGNVSEWTLDFYAIYTMTAAIDPPGPTSGTDRVFRGGSWDGSFATVVRAAYRNGYTPSNRDNGLGFRCSRRAN